MNWLGSHTVDNYQNLLIFISFGINQNQSSIVFQYCKFVSFAIALLQSIRCKAHLFEVYMKYVSSKSHPNNSSNFMTF